MARPTRPQKHPWRFEKPTADDLADLEGGTEASLDCDRKVERGEIDPKQPPQTQDF